MRYELTACEWFVIRQCCRALGTSTRPDCDYSLLFQHQSAFLAHQRLNHVGDLGEKPRQEDR
jgi:hypothetical protein